GIAAYPRIEPQPIAQYTRNAAIKPRAAQPQPARPGGQQQKRAKLARTRNLPLFPRLFQAPGRGGFSFFKVAIVGHARGVICRPRGKTERPAEILGGRAPGRSAKKQGETAAIPCRARLESQAGKQVVDLVLAGYHVGL